MVTHIIRMLMNRHLILTLLARIVSPVLARSLWSKVPATYGSSDRDDYILKTGYLIGNGKLGGSPGLSLEPYRERAQMM